MGVVVMASLLLLAGCALKSPIPEARHQQALELVDQGTLLLRDRRLDEAEASFSLAYDVAPLAAALDGQGCVAFLRGEWDRAEHFFREAYMADEEYDKAAANLALVLDAQGKPEQAREWYKWYLARHPEDAAVRNNMAALEIDEGSDKNLILQELLRAAAISRHDIIMDNITRLGNS
jgi:Flp pilus assembly protein TadD